MFVYLSSCSQALYLSPHGLAQPNHNMANQSALEPDGWLLDMTEIEWFNDPDDAQPIQPTSHVQEGAASYIVYLGTTNTVFCQVNAHVQSGQLQVHS